MIKLLLGSVALAAMSVGAMAADLPRREMAPAPAPIYAVPTFTWTGFYVGANLGGAWRKNNCSAFTSVGYTFDNVCSDGDDRRTSFTGGVQAGYNWQIGALVLGVEADINALGRGGNRGDAVFYDNYDGTYVVSQSRGGNYLGTVRGRLGYAVDRALFYVTGGLAFGGNRGNESVSYYYDRPAVGTPDATFVSARNSSNIGWALGAGVEFAVSNNWTVKLEYLHANIGRGNGGGGLTCTGSYCSDFNTGFYGSRRNNDVDMLRVGLNYKFGGPAYGASPVLARY